MAYKGRVRPTIALTSDDIAADAVGSSEIAAGAITNSEVADNALSGNKIDGGTISNFTSTGIDDNADAVAITIDSSEKVGIGETTPLTELHITTSDVAGTITPKYDNAITLETNSTAGINMFMNDLSEGGLNFGQTGAGNNNTQGEFVFSNYDNHFKWTTSESGNAATEKMRLKNNGSLGVGIDAPLAKMHVKSTGGGGTETEVLRLETTGTSDNSAVVTDWRTAHIRGNINLVDGPGSYDSNIVFKTGSGSQLPAPAERIRIGPTGEIGVGGANYGSDGQVLTSGGSGVAVAWEDASGGFDIAPLFAAEKNGNQTVSSSTWTKITGWTELSDSDGRFASDKFTPNTTGDYLIIISVAFSGVQQRRIGLFKNGSEHRHVNHYASDTDTDSGCTSVFVVNAGSSSDYFEFYFRHQSGYGNRNVYGSHTYFTGFRIG